MRSAIASGILLCGLMGCSVYAEYPTLRMVAFGNSISRGANCVGLKETPEYSWSTGTKIDSHLKRLEDQRHVMVVAKNVARVGVNSPDLKNQLKKMGEFVPDYATIEIGANDVCRNANTNIVKNVKMVIDRLVKINPNVEIVLAPIVKISSVHDVGSDWFCELAWSIECPAILGSLVTDEQRLLAQLKIDGINYSLQELAVLYPQVRFNMELGQMDVTQEFLSAADCFHPSAMGQQKISDLTFGY